MTDDRDDTGKAISPPPTPSPAHWDGRERRGPGRLDDEGRARRLLTQIRAGGAGTNAARDALVLQFKPLVLQQARQYMISAVPLEDMVQEGFLGLMNAIEGFDMARGTKFITYAMHHITGHLRHFLRDRTQIIKEPAWLQEMAQKVRREQDSLLQTLGREPTDAEVAEALGLREAEVARIAATRQTFSVSSLEEAQEAGTAAAHVADSNLEAARAQLPIEDRLVLEQALARLKDVEQKVLYSFYYQDMSQTDIARVLGVSNNYVSHILKNTARKLEQMFRGDATREAAFQHERKRLRTEMGLPPEQDDADLDDAVPTILDPVTGLYTQKYFDARLDEELSRARRHTLELSVLRVSVGEDLPEAALFAQAAQAVKGCTRRSDLVARAGEREIAALLPHTGATGNVVRARIAARLSEWKSGLPHPCTVTLGMASYPAHPQRAALLSAAAPHDAV